MDATLFGLGFALGSVAGVVLSSALRRWHRAHLRTTAEPDWTRDVIPLPTGDDDSHT